MTKLWLSRSFACVCDRGSDRHHGRGLGHGSFLQCGRRGDGHAVDKSSSTKFTTADDDSYQNRSLCYGWELQKCKILMLFSEKVLSVAETK